MRSTADCVDALRLSEAEQQAIIDELDISTNDVPDTQARRSERYRYAVPDGVIVQLEGSATRFLVRPRNISTGGLAFLHGSFLYPGAACHVTLTRVDGEQVLARGRIVRCRCVRGRVHEIGVEFRKPIPIDQFVLARPEAPGRNGTALDVDYPRDDVIALADELKDLAAGGAPRSDLYRKLGQLVALLRVRPPAAG